MKDTGLRSQSKNGETGIVFESFYSPKWWVRRRCVPLSNSAASRAEEQQIYIYISPNTVSLTGLVSSITGRPRFTTSSTYGTSWSDHHFPLFWCRSLKLILHGDVEHGFVYIGQLYAILWIVLHLLFFLLCFVFFGMVIFVLHYFHCHFESIF